MSGDSMSNPNPDAIDDDAYADALEGKTPGKVSGDAIGRGTLSAGSVASGTSGALTSQERESLTFIGATVSVQVRSYANLADGGQDINLAVHHPKDAPRSRENGRPWEVAELDVIKLRDLLNEATRRGLLP